MLSRAAHLGPLPGLSRESLVRGPRLGEPRFGGPRFGCSPTRPPVRHRSVRHCAVRHCAVQYCSVQQPSLDASRVRRGAAQCAWIAHMRDRIGLGRATPARPPGPGVLSPAARQHGHAPFARALAQGLPPGTGRHARPGHVGTLARAGGSASRRHADPGGLAVPRPGDSTAPRSDGSTAPRPDGPTAPQPGGSTAQNQFPCARRTTAAADPFRRRLQPAASRGAARGTSESTSDGFRLSRRRQPSCQTEEVGAHRVVDAERRPSEPLRTQPSRPRPLSARARGVPPISSAESGFTRAPSPSHRSPFHVKRGARRDSPLTGATRRSHPLPPASAASAREGAPGLQ